MGLQMVNMLRAGAAGGGAAGAERPLRACSGGSGGSGAAFGLFRRETQGNGLWRGAGVFCGPQRRGVRHFVRKCAVAGQINRRRACGFGAKSIYLRAGLLALGIFRRFRIFRSGPDGPFPEASGDSGSFRIFRIFRIFRLFRFFRIFRPFRLFRSPISTFHPPF